MKYWIEYTNGEKHVFEAEDKKAAYDYFYNEGDHAYDYGPLDKEHFKKQLEGPKTWGDIFSTPKHMKGIKDSIELTLREGSSGRAKYEIDIDDGE